MAPRADGDLKGAIASLLEAVRAKTRSFDETEPGGAGDGGDALDEETVQALMQLAMELYLQKVHGRGEDEPVPGILPARHPFTATDIMIVANELLNAGSLHVFEMEMWRTVGRY